MNEKYFIIRANRWYICWVKGTEEELTKFLQSVGTTIVSKETIHHEDMRLVYREKITTQTDAIGYNKELFNDLWNDISEKLSKINKRGFSYRESSLKEDIKSICRDVPLKSDCIDILVSDGEEYELPSNVFCGRRTFSKFSDINIEYFCREVYNCAYINIQTNNN